MCKGNGSKWKELNMLVNAVKLVYVQGIFDECELYLFKDNTVTRMTYYNVSSNKSTLLDGFFFSCGRCK